MIKKRAIFKKRKKRGFRVSSQHHTLFFPTKREHSTCYQSILVYPFRLKVIQHLTLDQICIHPRLYDKLDLQVHSRVIEKCRRVIQLRQNHPPSASHNMATHSTTASSAEQSSLVRNSIVAGSCSGLASTIVLYPMDVLRTKMQASSVQQTTGMRTQGPLYVFRHTLQHGGVPALYTGIGLPLTAQVIYKSTVFAVNNWTLQFILDHKQASAPLNYGDRFLCGFMGGAFNAALFVTPVELVRNQLIAQHTQQACQQSLTHARFRGSWDVIQYAMTQPESVRALWRGASWSFWRDGLGCGLFFCAMHGMQEFLTPPDESPTFATSIVSGGAAGLAFWLVGLPLDTVKTWVQSSTDWTVRFSVRSAVRDIYLQEGGFMGVGKRLLHGWQVAYGRGIPSAAITMSVYSAVYSELEKHSAVPKRID